MFYQEFLVDKQTQTDTVIVISPRKERSPASDSSDDSTDGSCFKRLRGSLKLPCMKADVSYEARHSDDDSSPILRKKAKRHLVFEDETPTWNSKEKSICRGTSSCCWSENDSVDELMAKYVELEKQEKQEKKTPSPVAGCSTWISPQKKEKKKTRGLMYSTQEINDLYIMVLRFNSGSCLNFAWNF